LPNYHNVQRAREILDHLARTWRFKNRVGLGLLSPAWKEAVGELIAAHSRPLRLVRGELVLAVENAAWMSELSFQTPVILERLAATLGPDKVKSLRLKTASLPPADEPPPPPEPLPPLDDFETERIERLIQPLKDDVLRAAIRRACVHSLQVRKQLAEKKLARLRLAASKHPRRSR